MLVARIDTGHPMAAYDGYIDERESSARVLRSAFEPEDAWFVTGDVLRIDSDGNYWFVDRAGDMVRTERGPVSSVHVEDVLYELPEIQHAVVVGVDIPGGTGQMPVAFVVVRDGYVLDPNTLTKHVEKRLDQNARPRFVQEREHIAMSVGYRPIKQPLRDEGVREDAANTLRYDSEAHLYEPLHAHNYGRTLAQVGGHARTEASPARDDGAKPKRPAASAKRTKPKEKPAR
jgi:hypothetical protein